MCMVLRTEDLVASAFIGLIEKKKEKNEKISDLKISVEQLAKYRYNVLNSMNEENKTAVLPISWDYMEQFLCRFDDYFYCKKNENNYNYIYLNEGKTPSDLQINFKLYIPSSVRKYFENEENLKPIFGN